MRKYVVAHLEAIGLLTGAVCMALAFAALDWRLGLFFVGAVILAASIDIAPRRRT